ncbi:PRC-barrel domain-containing protein [Ornithinimicrobium sp. Y1847]|uniref:PRC-barrel domain-containing protein n=1 Tax=Ornithinimicrobium sp. Y1847 TaxID=3405419 RepID=UPI003B6859D3
MRITQDNLGTLYDAEVVDRSGDKVGGVRQIFLDDNTGEPAWATVRTGFFGMKETFVPLDQADLSNGQIVVPFEKDFIKDAPNVDADQHLSESEQDELYRYYASGREGGHGADGRVEGDRLGDDRAVRDDGVLGEDRPGDDRALHHDGVDEGRGLEGNPAREDGLEHDRGFEGEQDRPVGTDSRRPNLRRHEWSDRGNVNPGPEQ